MCHGHISLLLFDVHPLHSSTLPRELMMRSWSPLFEEACWEKWFQVGNKHKEVLFKVSHLCHFKKKNNLFWICGCQVILLIMVIHHGSAILNITFDDIVPLRKKITSISVSCIDTHNCRTHLFGLGKSFPLTADLISNYLTVTFHLILRRQVKSGIISVGYGDTLLPH